MPLVPVKDEGRGRQRRRRRCPRPPGCHGDDRGAAAVEFAIVLPVLLLILFGIIDFGRLANQQILVTEAAREGARAAALGMTTPQIQARAALAADGHTIVTTVLQTCGSASTATSIAQVRVVLTWTPATPIGALMGVFGRTFDVPVTVQSTSVMSCIG